MQHRGKIALLFWVGACGDGGGSTTNIVTDTLSSAPLTSGPSTMSVGEETNDTGAATSAPTDGTNAASDDSNDSDPDSTSPTPTETTASTEPEANGPKFLSFSSDVMKITDGETVTFTALVTDPDGVDDIVGGSLLSGDEAIEFGPFVAAGQAGSYSFELSWAQVHQADPIEFENGEIARTFEARFFDQMGNKAIETVEIKLVCAGGASCSGVCKDLANDGENCGSCGRACDAGVDGCADGMCVPSLGPCSLMSDGLENCDAACADIQESCVENGCRDDKLTTLYFTNLADCNGGPSNGGEHKPCSEDHVWDAGFVAVKCCCTDTK